MHILYHIYTRLSINGKEKIPHMRDFQITFFIMPNDSKDIIRPAVITPKKIAGSESLFFILKSVAASAPVHAPVPGSGIATNR